jgi:hypothetical protein
MNSQPGTSNVSPGSFGPNQRIRLFVATLIAAMIISHVLSFVQYVSPRDFFGVPQDSRSLVEILVGLLGGAVLFPFFPWGLALWTHFGFYMCFFGWLAYGVISHHAVQSKSSRAFVVLYVIFVVLLVVNIAGCQMSSKWGPM